MASDRHDLRRRHDHGSWKATSSTEQVGKRPVVAIVWKVYKFSWRHGSPWTNNKCQVTRGSINDVDLRMCMDDIKNDLGLKTNRSAHVAENFAACLHKFVLRYSIPNAVATQNLRTAKHSSIQDPTHVLLLFELASRSLPCVLSTSLLHRRLQGFRRLVRPTCS